MNILINQDIVGVILVDVQGDFTTLNQGSLAVEGTDQSYIDALLKATKQLKDKGFKIFATQDFHPENHVSFYSNHKNKKPYETVDINGRTQMLWPQHCVMGTPNADILIDRDLFESIIQKGMDPKYDSYSGFFDDGGIKTELDETLKSHKVNTLIVYGLATDYCVRATAMDAIKLGFKVIVIENLCKGVAKDTSDSALKEMMLANITVIPTISDII